jgi:hypothetical protein
MEGGFISKRIFSLNFVHRLADLKKHQSKMCNKPFCLGCYMVRKLVFLTFKSYTIYQRVCCVDFSMLYCGVNFLLIFLNCEQKPLEIFPS